LLALLLNRRIHDQPWPAHHRDYALMAIADAHTYYSLDCSPAWEWEQLEVAWSGLAYRIRGDGNC
jgi:hypothetical protein